MNIDFHSYSGIGGRPVNEDSYYNAENCFIVSDGLGGHDNGELASEAAVNYIVSGFNGDISNDAVGALLKGADDAVRVSGNGGKATVAAIFSDGDKFRIANIGDSRVYYFRQGQIFFRTKDHSVCQASVDMGEMTDADVRSSADRSGLFKVLGDSEPLKLPKPYEVIYPQDGDAFLICSDGFWENVYEMEMEADFLKSPTAKEWLNHMLKRHLLRAKNEGDNFTAVCGIISAANGFPNTVDAASDIPVFIPAAQNYGEPAAPQGKSGKKTLLAICVSLIIVGAIGTGAALIINKTRKSSEVSDESVNTSLSQESGVSDSNVGSTVSEEASASGGTSTSGETSTSGGTSTSEEPGFPNESSGEPSDENPPSESDVSDGADSDFTSSFDLTPSFLNISNVSDISLGDWSNAIYFYEER